MWRLKKQVKTLRDSALFIRKKHPHLSSVPEKQIYHCFGCGKGGNVFNFLMTLENISYIEAIRLVAADLGISLPSYRASDPSDLPGEYDPYYQANEIASKYFYQSVFSASPKIS